MTTESQTRMPPGVGNAYLFQIFNTISFAIVLTTPMLLYFKGLGASGTVLGIVTALPALLNILQMPAARFVEQVGYRTFVLRGWSLRSLFILGIAGVAFLPAKIDPTTRMALVLFLLFAYNTSRGISVCGYLPWITQWIPEAVRGRYLSHDWICNSAATVATSLATAAYLYYGTSQGMFGTVFLASFVAAMISLLFLQRIPDVPPPHSTNRKGTPWKEIALYPPFFSLLVYNVIIFGALAGCWRVLGSVFARQVSIKRFANSVVRRDFANGDVDLSIMAGTRGRSGRKPPGTRPGERDVGGASFLVERLIGPYPAAELVGHLADSSHLWDFHCGIESRESTVGYEYCAGDGTQPFSCIV